MAEEVTIRITAQDNFSGVLSNFGNIITGIRSAVSLATDAFRALAVPIIELGKESALTAARVEELSLVDKILADNAGIARDSIDPLAQSLRDQGIQADIAYETIAQMIRANLDLADATTLARVAQDAAVVSGSNSSETLDRIIYGVTTLNPLILRHAGIIVDLQLGYQEWAEANKKSTDEMTTAEKQAVALNLVLEEGEKLTGAYSEAMGNAYKQLGSFDRYINDVKLSLGEQFLPALNEVVFSMADFWKWLNKAVQEGGVLEPVIGAIADKATELAENFSYAIDVLTQFAEYISGTSGDIPIAEDNPLLTYLKNLIDRSTETIEIVKDVFDPTVFMTGQDWVFPDLFNTGDIENEIRKSFDWELFAKNVLSDIADAFMSFADTLIDKDWGDVSDAIIEGINNIDWDKAADVALDLSQAAKKIKDILIKELGEFGWAEVGEALDKKLAEGIDSINWNETGRSVAQSIADAVKTALTRVFTTDEGKIDWFKVLSPGFAELRDLWRNSEIVQSIVFAVRDFFAGIFDAIHDAGYEQVDIWAGGVLDRIVEAFTIGWENAKILFANTFLAPFQYAIDAVKRLLGIASPSTVFYNIGRDIILGLIGGIGSMIAPMLEFVMMVAKLLISPFQPVVDVVGYLSGKYFGGGTDIKGVSGTVTMKGQTAAGGGNPVTNNYYGPVYFQGAGEPGIYYDCPSPNKFLSATGGQLVTNP